MSVWRRTRTEAAGAWRSLRYDMGRRPFEAPADGPDVTSTGMSTFGGLTSWEYGPEPTAMPVAGRMPAPRRRSPKRAMMVSAFGTLTVLGAAVSYLVVVNGFVPMRDQGPAAAGTLPTPPPAVVTTTTTADAGIGRSPKAVPTTKAVASVKPPVTHDAQPIAASPRKVLKPAAKPTSPLNLPPVPTPTAPAKAPTPTTPTTTSPSASPSTSDDPSTNPSESVEPRKSWQPGHHRRPH
jgi:hypothetical protein